MWIRPKAELDAKYPVAFLLDKKYVAHTDYQLILDDADRYGSRVLTANLGFGSRSVAFHARPFRYEPGKWHHVAFTYDGAGTGSFYIDGLPAGSTREEGLKSIAPGDHGLSIGDRIGSLFHGFPGMIDEVRITRGVREFRAARFDRLDDRTCFVRMESPVTLHFTVTNLLPTTMAQGTVTLELDDVAKQEKSFSDLASGKSVALEFPLDTTLRPDGYRLVARLDVPGPEPFASEETFAVRIVPRRPERFPVLMWGIYGGAMKEMDRSGADRLHARVGPGRRLRQDLGGRRADRGGQARAGGRRPAGCSTRPSRGTSPWSPASRPCRDKRGTDSFLRVDRKGKPYEREDICGLFPELQRFCYNVGASVAQTYGHYPAFGAALLHTEVRDSAELCFHQHDFEAFRQGRRFRHPGRGEPQTGRRLPQAARLSRLARHPRRSSDLRLLQVVLETGRRLERAEQRVGAGAEIDRAEGPLDVSRPGGPRGQRLRQRRRGGRALAVDVLLSRPDPHRPGDRRASGHGRRRGASAAGDEDDADHLVPQPDRPGAQDAGRRAALSSPVGARAARRAVHHDRPDAPARGVLDEDRPADQGHHVSRLAVAGAVRRRRGYRYTQPRDAARAGPADPRGGPAAGPDAAGHAGREERRGLSGEFRLADVRRPRHLRLGRRLGGRRLPRHALRPSPAGDRLRRDDRRARARRLPRAGDARLRRDHPEDGRRDQEVSSRAAGSSSATSSRRRRSSPTSSSSRIAARAGRTRTRPPCRPSPPSSASNSTPATRATPTPPTRT